MPPTCDTRVILCVILSGDYRHLIPCCSRLSRKPEDTESLLVGTALGMYTILDLLNRDAEPDDVEKEWGSRYEVHFVAFNKLCKYRFGSLRR